MATDRCRKSPSLIDYKRDTVTKRANNGDCAQVSGPKILVVSSFLRDYVSNKEKSKSVVPVVNISVSGTCFD